MKKLLIFLFVISCYQMQAQHRGACGTTISDQVHKLDLRDYNTLNNPVIQNREDELYVPVIFHMVAENNGSNRVEESAVLDQFCKLQEDYANSNFIFYLKDITIINNSLLFNSAGTDGAGTASAISDSQGAGAVNIFITENADNNGNSLGVVLGFYTPNGDYIILRKNEVSPPSSTLSHEVGHFFSLAHPHLGWECEAYAAADHGNPVNIVNTPCGWAGNDVQIDLVDYSNCSISGDRICDTQADYNFPFSIGLASGCNYTGDIKDRNGDDLIPMEENYMGYFDACQAYEFSPMQFEAMDSDFLSPERAYLRSTYVPNMEEVTGTPTISEPANGATTEFYDNVFFDWNDIANADLYLLELTSGSGKSTYIVDKSEARLFDLEEGTTYFFSVRAYNETSTCAPKTGVMTVKTGSSSSSVTRIEGLSGLKISPNPVSGSNVNVSFDLNKAQNINIQLVDFKGAVLNQIVKNSYDATHQNVAMDVSDLSSGIYFIRLINEAGVNTTKLVVTK